MTTKMATAMVKFFFCAVLISLNVLWHVNPASGQTLTTGQVLGQVIDPSGAGVPGANVELRDAGTAAKRTATTNSEGQYVFPQVTPGVYSVTVTASGFAKLVVPSVTVEVDKTASINVSLKLGNTSEVVEVHSTPGAELQTLDSTVGNTIGGEEILALPTLGRSATSLLLLQPMAMPQQSTGQSSRFGGQVAGARSDQNSFLLDGGEITVPIAGNSDYLRAFSGEPEGAIPTPVESIQEFKVETNNPSGSISVGGGAQVVMVTKRGGEQFHGSLYEYYRGSALNANRWDANRLGQKKPNIVDNRFGASLGGHFLPGAWKSFFYAHFEERRRSDARFITRIVPTASMRAGILKFSPTNQSQWYNLNPRATVDPATGATVPVGGCPSSGALNQNCDPRNLGLNPVISQLWQFEPSGNDTSQGDGLNTIGFSGFARFPVNNYLGVLRVDHSFGSRLHWTANYRHYREDAGFLRQVDIGGVLPGDVNGVPKVLSSIPRQPRYFVTGLTANITPYLTNDFHASWLRDWWEWVSLPPFPLPQLTGTGIPAALVPGGDTLNALVPLNIDTQNARTRLWNSHGMDFRDDASWVRGNHLFQFGGSFKHTWVFFRRDDGQQNSQKTLQYFMGNTIGGISFPNSIRPPGLPTSQISNWNNLYAQVLGMTDAATILRARDASLQLLPEGNDLKNTVRYDQATFYAQDAWHLRPSLTVSYGLAWAATVPPVEEQGKLMITVLPGTGEVVDPRSYLQKRQQAAMAGQVYNPAVGFTPIKNSGRKYPFDFVRHNFEPRAAAAWTPNFSSGPFKNLFGNGKTVLRGGYWRFYDRLNGVQTAVDTLQAVGFGQSLLCLGPGINSSTALDCRGNSGTNPLTAFRIGTDGNTITLPPLPATITPPVIPGNSLVPVANISFVPNSQIQDPAWKPGSHNQWDFTIQRELPANSRLEIGYVGHTARNIYQGIDLNQVPFFMVSGGQSFAQAFDALARGVTTPQPFFETALAGSSFCTSGSCTAGVASRFGGDIANQRVRNVFNGIQSQFALAGCARPCPATNAATQFTNFYYWSSLAESNYHAAFVSYHIRAYRGLVLDANFTYGHSLDNTTVNQDSDAAFANSYDPHYDYGTSVFDRKYVLTVLGVWDVPLRSQNAWVKRVVGGWQLSPIVSVASGLPLRVLDGSGQEFGQTPLSNTPSEAIRSGSGDASAGVNRVAPATGTGSSASGKGSGLNIFANPDAVLKQFRPVQLSVDTTSRGGTLRGFGTWNLDLSIAKKIYLNAERTRLTFSAEFFNTFNHLVFLDPAVSLQSPQTFGVITTQGNDPRQIQLGLRLDF